MGIAGVEPRQDLLAPSLHSLNHTWIPTNLLYDTRGSLVATKRERGVLQRILGGDGRPPASRRGCKGLRRLLGQDMEFSGS
jgi:hypothetical protein